MNDQTRALAEVLITLYTILTRVEALEVSLIPVNIFHVHGVLQISVLG